MWSDSSISSIKFVKVVGNIPNLWKSLNGYRVVAKSDHDFLNMSGSGLVKFTNIYSSDALIIQT